MNRWTWAWLFVGLFVLGMELAALAIDGAHDSASAQVWLLLDRGPWVYWPTLALFGGFVAWLTLHFWGRRR